MRICEGEAISSLIEKFSTASQKSAQFSFTYTIEIVKKIYQKRFLPKNGHPILRYNSYYKWRTWWINGDFIKLFNDSLLDDEWWLNWVTDNNNKPRRSLGYSEMIYGESIIVNGLKILKNSIWYQKWKICLKWRILYVNSDVELNLCWE